MDETVFTGDIVKELQRIELGAAERAQLIALQNPEQLKTAEQFLHCMMRVPGYDLRLECFAFRSGFDDWSQGTRMVLLMVTLNYS